MTNTLAYYGSAFCYGRKKFYKMGQSSCQFHLFSLPFGNRGSNTTKLFTAAIDIVICKRSHYTRHNASNHYESILTLGITLPLHNDTKHNDTGTVT